jgi:hypothetical protein
MFNLINRALADSGGTTTSGGIIKNPLANINSINELILKILDLIVKIGLPLMALSIIYVGFLFIKARGNEGELKTAKNAFLWVIIGSAIVLGAQLIAVGIQNTINSL